MSNSNLPPYHEQYGDIVFHNSTSKDYIERILQSFSFQESDIILVSYPRSGTLLTQEIIWHIKHRESVTLGQNCGSLVHRFPHFEFSVSEEASTNSVDILERQTGNRNRFIKTHLPAHLIFDRIKHCKCIVFLYREAKDVAISYFNFYRGFMDPQQWNPSWEEFFDHFISGRVEYGSYFQWNQSWMKLKEFPNIYAVKYENLMENKVSEIQRLAEFLGVSNMIESEILGLVENSSFKELFINPDINIRFEKDQSLKEDVAADECGQCFSKEQEESLESASQKFFGNFEK